MENGSEDKSIQTIGFPSEGKSARYRMALGKRRHISRGTLNIRRTLKNHCWRKSYHAQAKQEEYLRIGNLRGRTAHIPNPIIGVPTLRVWPMCNGTCTYMCVNVEGRGPSPRTWQPWKWYWCIIVQCRCLSMGSASAADLLRCFYCFQSASSRRQQHGIGQDTSRMLHCPTSGQTAGKQMLLVHHGWDKDDSTFHLCLETV